MTTPQQPPDRIGRHLQAAHDAMEQARAAFDEPTAELRGKIRQVIGALAKAQDHFERALKLLKPAPKGKR
jgi:acyl-CoA reductase-like NAD-dependent aldehyde dehydrogenase